MKNFSVLMLAALPMLTADPHAHALWTEKVEGGYKVFYGEPGKGLRENKEKLAGLGGFRIWDASGKELKGTLGDDHLFVAAGPGGIRVSALEMDLYGKGEHAGKPYFHARYAADPGKRLEPVKDAPLEILPEGEDSLSFVVLKGGKPLASESLTLIAPGGWSKSFPTDAQGKVRIEAPWTGQYILEVGVEDKQAGRFKDKPYASVYHAATLVFVKK